MNAPLSSSEIPFNDAPSGDVAAALEARQLAMLDRMAEIGMTLMEAVGHQVTVANTGEGDATTALSDLAFGLTRVSRAVRMNIALQSRLIAGGLGSSTRAGADQTSTIEDLRYREDAERQQAAERDRAEAIKRLQSPCDAVTTRSDNEIIDHIHRDLGLQYPNDCRQHPAGTADSYETEYAADPRAHGGDAGVGERIATDHGGETRAIDGHRPDIRNERDDDDLSGRPPP